MVRTGRCAARRGDLRARDAGQHGAAAVHGTEAGRCGGRGGSGVPPSPGPRTGVGPADGAGGGGRREDQAGGAARCAASRGQGPGVQPAGAEHRRGGTLCSKSSAASRRCWSSRTITTRRSRGHPRTHGSRWTRTLGPGTDRVQASGHRPAVGRHEGRMLLTSGDQSRRHLPAGSDLDGDTTSGRDEDVLVGPFEDEPIVEADPHAHARSPFLEGGPRGFQSADLLLELPLALRGHLVPEGVEQ